MDERTETTSAGHPPLDGRPGLMDREMRDQEHSGGHMNLMTGSGKMKQKMNFKCSSLSVCHQMKIQ